ncbi:pyrolysin [Ceratobasidium sp. AG-Ba]|nr:pyrolysin [Ceratobasidium sp. AG-Ba]QRW02575.1 pyrolysin [Ceratobasidium sp. AG-Ba]
MENLIRSWEEAGLQVESAVLAFKVACVQLRMAILTLDGPIGLRASRDQASVICSRYESIESAIHQLTASHRTIGSMINELDTRAVINRVPETVLLAIFKLASASTFCTIDRQPTDPLIVIPSVCRRWRTVALETGSLWSHIDIDLSRDDTLVGISRDPLYHETKPQGKPYRYDRAAMWASRAGDFLIDVHFRNDTTVYNPLLATLNQLFKPFSKQIRSLVFSEQIWEPIPQTMISLCGWDGLAGALNELVLKEGLHVDRSRSRFLLKGILPQRLTVLRLHNVPQRATGLNMSKLLLVLKNCSTLQALQLNCTRVLVTGQEDAAPIRLAWLQYLDIGQLSKEAHLCLLSILHVGKQDLHMIIGLTVDQELLAATDAFFQRAKIVTLAIEEAPEWGHHGPIQHINQHLSYLPNMRSLFFDMGSGCQDRLGSLADPWDGQALLARSPGLQRLYIYGGFFDQQSQDRMKYIVQAFSLAEVGFVYQQPWDDERVANFLTERGIAGPRGEESEYISWLKDRVDRFSVDLNHRSRGLEWDSVFDRIKHG